MHTRLLFAFLFLATIASAQKLNKYWVEFKDKENSPYCICRPGEFLSQRALERRERANIPVVENDLPVSPGYVSALKSKGLQIHCVSKWLNAVALIADSSSIKIVNSLPFVQRYTYLGPHLKFRNPPNRPEKKRVPASDYPKPGGSQNPMGYTTLQNSLLNLLPLYAAGHRGKGIWIAVMDGGFTNVDTMPFFDSVGLQGRLHPGWDFVERDAGLFEAAGHGTSVLSLMAANLPGYFVGTAPEATYFLLKTEDTGGEFPIEEANWIAGAEWADSIGVDIINASLGYTSFNDTTLSHHYASLDGRTAIGSRGAAIAASKGMVVCNSAGNEGDGTWHYIGVPADAAGVIAVGAVNSTGDHAKFSSFGPTSDGRIKPDLVAPGDDVVVAGNYGTELGISSGTSLASPMLVGAIAALWSAYPEKNGEEIMEAVFRSADQFENPDNTRGWGLPDMTLAWVTLGKYFNGQSTFAFDRNYGKLSLLVTPNFFKNGDLVELVGIDGHHSSAALATISPNDISTVDITGLEKLPPGAYTVRISNEELTQVFPVMIWP